MSNYLKDEAEYERNEEVTKRDSSLDPKIVSQYLQLFFNSAIGAVGLYIMMKFIQLVNKDVQRKMEDREITAMKTALACRNQYSINKCQPDARAPALEQKCSEWYYCMNHADKDKNIQQSATLWAETLAEILNAFLKPISVRSLFFILVTSCGVILVTNMAFYSYRIQYYGVTRDNGR